VSGNNFVDMADAAIYLSTSNIDVNFSGNNFKDCTNAAFNVYGIVTGFSLTGNQINNCGVTPISIDGAATVTNRHYAGNVGLGDLQDWIALTPADTTPNINAGNRFTITNSGAITITNFDGGTEGVEILLWFLDSNTTINRDGCLLAGGANFTSADNSTLRLVKKGAYWVEVGRTTTAS
jgi:hypothetical protein